MVWIHSYPSVELTPHLWAPQRISYEKVRGNLPPGCIAAEVNAIIATNRLPRTDVPTKSTGCFDLVAARGMRGGSGRCACHVAAPTSARFDVPAIKAETTWAEAEDMLAKVPLLTAKVMRDDSHTPPKDWDYSKGAWVCPRGGGEVSFKSKAHFFYREGRLPCDQGGQVDQW